MPASRLPIVQWALDYQKREGAHNSSDVLSIKRHCQMLWIGGHQAAIYTARQGAKPGALFCTFNENGIENRAHCYLRDIAGNVPDEFDVIVHH